MNLLAVIPLWRTRGPRFLVLLIVGWVALRSAAYWPEPDMRVLQTASPIAVLQAAAEDAEPPERAVVPAPPVAVRALARSSLPAVKPPGAHAAVTPDLAPALDLPSLWSGPERHRWRLAMLLDVMPRPGGSSTAALAVRNLAPVFPAGAAAPPLKPVWPVKPGSRWALSGYALWRAGARTAPVLATDRPATLGSSQAGVRVDYVLDRARNLRAFARVTASPVGPDSADLAVGVSTRLIVQPVVDLHLEQRFAVAGGAPDRALAYVTSGVDDRPLGQGYLLSGYVQAGVAGFDRAEGFVDGSAAIQRPVYARQGLRLSIGAMVAGAAQRGAARLDVGPRATVQLSGVGQGASIAVDWRERIAGDADPGSGIALTLAAGF
jgi:hypothetical protein